MAPSRDSEHRAPGGTAGGFTLLELLITTVLLAIAVGIGAEGLRRYRDSVSLDQAASAARGRIAQARMLGVARRGVVRLRITPEGALELRDPEGKVAGMTPLLGRSFALDSVRLRPSVLRFNARGQAGPGSLYLYGKDRGVRIVSNFLGRVRMERFEVP